MPPAIQVTPNPDAAQLEQLGVAGWPIWTCGVSTVPWADDDCETCLLLEGGEPVRKHYRFG